jgi:hypothetical protein
MKMPGQAKTNTVRDILFSSQSTQTTCNSKVDGGDGYGFNKPWFWQEKNDKSFSIDCIILEDSFYNCPSTVLVKAVLEHSRQKRFGNKTILASR